MRKRILVISIFIVLFFSQLILADEIDPTNPYAWSENAGWVNFAPSNSEVSVYSDHLEGYAWAENIGWIKLGSYSGGGSHTYSNSNSSDWGVNNDGNGNLSGYAWSENAGWINFNPNHSQVTIDQDTGEFDGYAWGENIGWIHFKNASPAAYKVRAVTTASEETAVSSATEIDCGADVGVDLDFGSVTINTSGAVVVNIHDGAPGDQTGLPGENVSLYRIEIIKTSGLAFTGAVTVQIDPTEFPLGLGIDGTLGTVNVYRRATFGSGSFSDLGNDLQWTGSEYTFTTTDFSEFVFTSNDEPLPVELTEFHAEVVNGGIKLHWTTASEMNNAGFKIYRKDGDLPGFQNLEGLIEGAGTTSEPQQYSFTDNDVQPNILYTYQIADIEEGTGVETLHPAITIMATKEGLESSDIPDKYALHANYPNPFNPTTTIEFDVPVGTYNHTSLRIYDSSGKLVKTLIDEPMDAGKYSVSWHGKDDSGNAVSSGTYYCKMVTEEYSETRQLVLLK
jgi:hypothetical protein